MRSAIGRFAIENVHPTVECGRFPAKAVVGELVPVSVTAYREGHDAIGVCLVWQDPGGERVVSRMRPGDPGTDRWHAVIEPAAVGAGTFTVEAFHDPYLTWRYAVTKKVEAGQDAAELANDLATGAAVMDAAEVDGASGAAAALRDEALPVAERIAPALALADALWERPIRELTCASEPYDLWVDRPRGLFSAWYEFFPRSEGAVLGVAGRSGTFATAAKRLPAVAAMGFDIVYLPPIHPIGRINRKGKDNALVAGPDDVGSPWAIGAAEGGHDAVHPDLGTAEDFRAFVAAARDAGLEVALDLALQCAPDHPWVAEHPEWFTTLADGTIAYAENPPKKYQDIYPLNFDNDPDGIRTEIRRVVLHWVGEGVKVFRVDNPHTKPIDFWQWLIAEVHAVDPEVIFLAEAFTRPAIMHGLAKIGFTQSYTYFTWRNTAESLREYCTELVASAHYMRPNFWPTTPDILPEILQRGGPAMFRIRAILAALLAPSWGVYSAYELMEHEARAGADEYRDNEKYELRPRDFAGAEEQGRSLAPLFTQLNAIRRANPALQRLRNLRFHDTDNPSVLCFSKHDERSGNTVLVVCSLDPINTLWARVTIDGRALSLDPGDALALRDELSGETYEVAQQFAVRVDPMEEPAYVFAARRGDTVESSTVDGAARRRARGDGEPDGPTSPEDGSWAS